MIDNKNKKILVVDDEENIRKLVSAYLKAEGYEVFLAEDGQQGLERAINSDPDLIILDVMLPVLDGVEVLARLRQRSNVYVIMLTAKAEEVDRIVGLSVGADDYVTKPFSPKELVARIKAAFRRMDIGQTTAAELLEFKNIRIDVGERRVWVRGDLVDLTTTEFELLYHLANNSGRVLSRDLLLENIWGSNVFGEMRVVDVHIGHLRQKLGEGFIETVRGIGYRFEDPK